MSTLFAIRDGISGSHFPVSTLLDPLPPSCFPGLAVIGARSGRKTLSSINGVPYHYKFR